MVRSHRTSSVTDAPVLPLVAEGDAVRRHRSKSKGRMQRRGRQHSGAVILTEPRGSRSRSRGNAALRRSGAAFFSPDPTRSRQSTSSQSRQSVQMNLTIALHAVLPDADLMDVVSQLTDVKAHIIVVLFEKEDGYVRGGAHKSKFFSAGVWEEDDLFEELREEKFLFDPGAGNDCFLVFNKNIISPSVTLVRKKVCNDRRWSNAGYLEIRCKICSSGNNMDQNPESVEDFYFGVMDACHSCERFPKEILKAVYDSVMHNQVRLVAGVFGNAYEQISNLMDDLSPSHTEPIGVYFDSSSGEQFTYPAFMFLFSGFAGVDIQRSGLPQWRYFSRRFFNDVDDARDANYGDRFIVPDFVPSWTSAFGCNDSQIFPHSTPLYDFGMAHAKKANLSQWKRGVWQVLLFSGSSKRRSDEAIQRRKSKE